ncbi:Transposase, partial [Thermosyntropha lipolytica DSM 11003]
AYFLKEKFMDFVNAANSGEAEIKLNEWLELVKVCKIEQFSYLANTISNWKEEILNSFDVPYTNACTEGFNNKIKVIKRNAYGYRNFSRFRNRILHCCS